MNELKNTLDLVQKIGGPFAAIIGALNPAAGAGIGVAVSVGTVLANALGPMLGLDPDDVKGVEEAARTKPDEVAKAVEAVNNDPAKLSEAMALAVEETKRMADVAITQRLELGVESLFVKNARPFSIWVIGIATLIYAVGFGFSLIGGIAVYFVTKDASAFKALELVVNAAPGFMTLLIPCGAVAGVTAWSRGQEKIAGVAGSPVIDLIRNGAALARQGR